MSALLERPTPWRRTNRAEVARVGARSGRGPACGSRHGRGSGSLRQIEEVPRHGEILPHAPGRARILPDPVGAPWPELALVHDYLLVMRGAERTFAAMADCWPDAPIFTLLYDAAATEGASPVAGFHVAPAVVGVGQGTSAALLPLFPVRPSDCQVYAQLRRLEQQRVRPRRPRREGATHVCYCHSPFRYAWHERPRARRGSGGRCARRSARAAPAARLGRRAARTVDHYIANSGSPGSEFGASTAGTRRRPPAGRGRSLLVGEPEDFFLFVSEVVRHKRPELALEAASRGRRIKVVGIGPELGRLQARYGRQAEFLGRVADAELATSTPAAPWSCPTSRSSASRRSRPRPPAARSSPPTRAARARRSSTGRTGCWFRTATRRAGQGAERRPHPLRSKRDPRERAAVFSRGV